MRESAYRMRSSRLSDLQNSQHNNAYFINVISNLGYQNIVRDRESESWKSLAFSSCLTRKNTAHDDVKFPGI